MSRQTVEFSITAAEKLNETLNAFLQIDREGALQRVTEIETSGRAGPLAGVPVAVKDNICVKGMQASCGSKILGDYHPPYNATVIERLIKAGAVIIGKSEEGALCVAGPVVSGGRRPGVRLAEEPHIELFPERLNVRFWRGRTAIVDDNHFKMIVRICLR